MPNGILVSFLFLCALSPRKGMLRVSFLLFIGVLLRHTSCLFAWYLQKCLLREEIFYHLSVCNFGPQEVSSLPFPGPLFLTRYSVCCTFDQHTGLFLRCTIKEFLCLTPLFSLLWFWGTCFLPVKQKGQVGGTVDWVRW